MEPVVRALAIYHGFEIATMSYRITPAGLFEYRMDVRTTNAGRAAGLAKALQNIEAVREFRVSTTGT